MEKKAFFKKKDKIMSNLCEHARKELEIAGLFDKDSDYNGEIANAVMELMEVFSKQGHSGYSASMVSSIFNKLSRFQTITPLTGEDSEWSNIGNDTFQNNRDCAVFKDNKTGKCTYLDAIVWKTDKNSWSGWCENVSSSQEIKSFPFTPKTFVIEVNEKEVAKDDWEFSFKNKSDLDKVWEFYVKPIEKEEK